MSSKRMNRPGPGIGGLTGGQGKPKKMRGKH
jgi:hypothetical protein